MVINHVSKSWDDPPSMGYDGLLDPDRPQSVDISSSRMRLASSEALKVGWGENGGDGWKKRSHMTWASKW